MSSLAANALGSAARSSSRLAVARRSLIIGRHGTKDESYFNGSIDEVKLFARALSNDELVSEATR